MGPIASDFTIFPDQMTFVKKGWGYERWIYNGADYCGKILFFEKDKKCSYHLHRIKDEVLYLHSGRIIMKYAEHDDLEKANVLIMQPGMAFHVTPLLRHQMIAEEDSLMYEFSTHHEDSDSYRIVRGD